jgi:hypothetical protein
MVRTAGLAQDFGAIKSGRGVYCTKHDMVAAPNGGRKRGTRHLGLAAQAVREDGLQWLLPWFESSWGCMVCACNIGCLT